MKNRKIFCRKLSTKPQHSASENTFLGMAILIIYEPRFHIA